MLAFLVGFSKTSCPLLPHLGQITSVLSGSVRRALTFTIVIICRDPSGAIPFMLVEWRNPSSNPVGGACPKVKWVAAFGNSALRNAVVHRIAAGQPEPAGDCDFRRTAASLSIRP